MYGSIYAAAHRGAMKILLCLLAFGALAAGVAWFLS